MDAFFDYNNAPLHSAGCKTYNNKIDMKKTKRYTIDSFHRDLNFPSKCEKIEV